MPRIDAHRYTSKFQKENLSVVELKKEDMISIMYINKEKYSV